MFLLSAKCSDYLPSEPTEATPALEVTEVHHCHHPRGTQLKLCLPTSYSVGRTLSPAKWITPSNFCSANSLSTAWQSGCTAATLLRHLWPLGILRSWSNLSPPCDPNSLRITHVCLEERSLHTDEDSHRTHLRATKLQVILSLHKWNQWNRWRTNFS